MVLSCRLAVGFFFITVGFNIDFALIMREWPRIAAIFVTMIAGKTAIITVTSGLYLCAPSDAPVNRPPNAPPNIIPSHTFLHTLSHTF